MAFLPTNASQVQQFAVGLYGIKVGSATMAAVQADITSIGGLNKALNSYYAASFGSSTTAAVAASVAANLGLTGTAATDAAAYITAVLNGTAATARGEAIMGVLSLFSTLTANATFGAAATAWNTKVASAVAYTGVADAAVAAGSVAEGQIFTLTDKIDTPAATDGNDTFIGDFTATATLNAGDQIAGGAGSDKLVMYGTYAAANMPVTITSVETVELKVAADAALDFTAWAKSATGIEKFVVADAALLNARTITTTAGQSVSLATGATSAVTAGTVTWAASATDTAANLTLNGYQAIAGGTPAALTVTGAATKTLNIASTGGTNKTGTFTGPTSVTKHVITGDKALTYTLAAADAAALDSVDASATTGGVTLNANGAANKAAFVFKGGSGNDTIKLADNQLGTLTSGAQLDGGAGSGDKLGILDTALTAAEITAINTATGFEKLGLNAAITLDASVLTSIKDFSIDTTALTQVINNMKAGSTTTLTTGTPTSLTLAPAVGVSDTTYVIAATSTALTTTALVTSGFSTVNVTSNGAAGVVNVITTLTNGDNNTINVTGTAGLTVTNAIAGTATGSKVDASTLAGALTVKGSAKADIIIGGAGADSITGGDGTDTLTGGAAADTFSFTYADNAGADGAAVADIITDFVAGLDKLQFTAITDVVSGQQAAVQTAVTALAAGSTDAQIATAMAATNTTDLAVSFAVYNGATYVYLEKTGATATHVEADNILIKLAGVTTAPTFAADITA